MEQVELVVDVQDDRSRLTSFFRLFTALPHLIWAALWGYAAYLAAIGSWFAILFTGHQPRGLWRFIANWLAYRTVVAGYASFATDRFPPFSAEPGYAARVSFSYPERQSRLKTFFRGILAIPAIVVFVFLNYARNAIAFLLWIWITITARAPRGLWSFQVTVQRYELRTMSYLLFATDRYPNFEEDEAAATGLPPADEAWDAPPAQVGPAPTAPVAEIEGAPAEAPAPPADDADEPGQGAPG